MALIPGVITAIILLAGLAAIGGEWFFAIRLMATIFAAIVAGLAIQGRNWWWLIPLAPVIVIWNPVFPLEFDGDLWRILHIVGAAAVLLAGLFITVPVPEGERGSRRR